MCLVSGAVDDAPRLLPVASYDVVICHGVLMYLPDPGPPLGALAAMLRPGGALSDTATLDAPPPGADLQELLAAEELAGRTDPYRAVAPLIQLVARLSTRSAVGGPT